MSVFEIAAMSVGISCLFLTLVALIFGNNKLHRLLLFFNLAVTVWGFGLYLMSSAGSAEEAKAAWKFALMGGIFVAPSFFHMISVYCNSHSPKLKLFAYAQAFIFFPAIAIKDLVVSDIRQVFGLPLVDPNAFFTLLIVIYVFFVILSFAKLIRFTGNVKGRERTLALYNIVGFLIGFTGASTIFLPIFGLDLFFPTGNFGIPIYAFILTYAILRHQLMDIHLVFKRTIVYSISTALITSLFVALVLVLTRFFSIIAGIDSFYVTIFAALVIATIFHPLKSSVASYVEKFFFRSNQDHSQIIKDASNKLAAVSPLEIKSTYYNSITNALEVKNSCLLTSSNGHFKPIYSNFDTPSSNHQSDVNNLVISNNSCLVKEIKNSKKIIRTINLFLNIKPDHVYKIKNELRPYNCEIVVPVFIGNILTDLLIIGEKHSGDLFYEEDINLIQTLTNQASISLKNASLYVELKSQLIEKTKEINERKKIEEEKEKLQYQLQQTQKIEAVGQLAGGIAHDFNNILSVILGYCDIVLESLPPENEHIKDMRLIKESGEKAASLTRQLLAFSRKQVLEMQVVKLNSLIDNISQMLRRMITEDIDLEVNLDASLQNVFADQSQLEQVLMNLTINARDAMPNGGKLIITTSNVTLDDDIMIYHDEVKPGHYTMFTISDSGTGMTSEVQERIFEPFFTTKEEGKGTGLGLATVYGIVKQHNGYVYVYSEPSLGTTFKIYLPAIHEISSTVIENIVTDRPHGTETILVVEDDVLLRNYILTVLKKLGYSTIEAGNGEEALKISYQHEENIHLLLTDVIMPGMNGKELTDLISQDRPNMKILYMSGYTDDVIAHHGVLEDGINFIQKPVTMGNLSGTIRNVIDSQ